jgi:hypothetical protein
MKVRPAPIRVSTPAPPKVQPKAADLTPAAKTQGLLPTVTPSKIAAVAPVSGAHVAQRPLTMDKLLPGLAYGCSGMFRQLDAALRENPEGALAKALHWEPDELPLHDLSQDARLAAQVCVLVDSCGADLNKLEATVGPEGRGLVDALRWMPNRPTPERGSDAFLGGVLKNLGELLPKDKALALADKLVRNDALIPKSVPTLDYAKTLVPPDVLSGKGLVAVQHPFPTFVPLLEALVDKGMRPQDIHVLGSGYFEGAMVREYCRLKGFDVDTEHGEETWSQRAATFHASDLQDFLGRVATSGPPPPKGWVVLDDGGLLHSTMGGHTKELTHFNEAASERADRDQRVIAKAFAPDKVKGVEQTTRGLTEMAKHPPPYPVVTVADAPGKAREAEMIGYSVAHSFLSDLRHQPNAKDVHKVVVISAGKIGRCTAEHLKQAGYEVSLMDTDPKKVEEAKALGFDATVDLQQARRGAQAILACTGKHSIDRGALDGFQGFVASGSSQVVDFDPNALQAQYADGVTVLNNGRPLNFKPDGHEDLDKEHIGLTRSLLFQAICQDGAGQKGPVALDLAPQDKVVHFWAQHGGEKLPDARPAACELSRPDLISKAGASDYDWSTFFANSDRPATTSFLCSFFQDTDGSVRYVPGKGGTSSPVALPSVPTEILGSSASPTVTLIGGQPGKRWLRLADMTPEGGLKLREPVNLGHIETWAMGRDVSGIGVAATRGDTLVLLDPAHLDTPREVALPPATQRVVAWASELDPPVVFGKGPASVTVVGDPPEWKGYALPKDFVEVTGVDRVLFSRQLVLTGKDKDGNVVVTALDRTGESKVIHLPPGARYRGVHLEGFEAYDHKSACIVDWVPAGVPDELDQWKHDTLALPVYAQDVVLEPR